MSLGLAIASLPTCPDILLGLYVLWPGFRRAGDYPAQFYRTWLHQAREAPHLMYAMLYATSSHTQSLVRGGLCPADERLRYRAKALEAIRIAVADPASDPENLIMTILWLAFNDGFILDEPIAEIPAPFQSPLQRLQWVDYYGSRTLHPQHWEALQSLIVRCGGIENLKGYGLPWLLSL